MEQESNIRVRDAIDRLERSLSSEQNSSSRSSAEDFSIPGYLRTTASSINKNNKKQKLVHSSDRRQFQNTNSAVPTKIYDGNHYKRQESRESSVFSITATDTDDLGGDDPNENDPSDDDPESQAQFEKLCLYAQYLQWVFLHNKAKIAFEHKKRATERELSLGMAAVKEKRKREAVLFKERNAMLSDRDVRKHVQQAQKIVNKIKAKLAAKNRDLVEEKKELSIILDNMNDLKIPMASVHENIKELIKTRELIKSIIQMP